METQATRLTDVIGPLPYRMAFAGGWIDQPFVGHAIGHQHGRGHLEQVAGHKGGGGQRALPCAQGLVMHQVLARAGHQGVVGCVVTRGDSPAKREEQSLPVANLHS